MLSKSSILSEKCHMQLKSWVKIIATRFVPKYVSCFSHFPPENSELPAKVTSSLPLYNYYAAEKNLNVIQVTYIAMIYYILYFVINWPGFLEFHFLLFAMIVFYLVINHKVMFMQIKSEKSCTYLILSQMNGMARLRELHLQAFVYLFILNRLLSGKDKTQHSRLQYFTRLYLIK